jgi:hypothetical protein
VQQTELLYSKLEQRVDVWRCTWYYTITLSLPWVQPLYQEPGLVVKKTIHCFICYQWPTALYSLPDHTSRNFLPAPHDDFVSHKLSRRNKNNKIKAKTRPAAHLKDDPSSKRAQHNQQVPIPDQEISTISTIVNGVTTKPKVVYSDSSSDTKKTAHQ